MAFRELARRHDVDVTEFHMLRRRARCISQRPRRLPLPAHPARARYQGRSFDLEPPLHHPSHRLPRCPSGRTEGDRDRRQRQWRCPARRARCARGGHRHRPGHPRPSDPMALEPGDILVAPHTDPAWTPLFVPAAGVVVNVGAQASHAIIVSRESGDPVCGQRDGGDRVDSRWCDHHCRWKRRDFTVLDMSGHFRSGRRPFRVLGSSRSPSVASTSRRCRAWSGLLGVEKSATDVAGIGERRRGHPAPGCRAMPSKIDLMNRSSASPKVHVPEDTLTSADRRHPTTLPSSSDAGARGGMRA